MYITHPNFRVFAQKSPSANCFYNSIFIYLLQLVPVGARLAEMARIRLQYDETRQQVQHIQQVLSFL